jgi:hypothetical protein
MMSLTAIRRPALVPAAAALSLLAMTSRPADAYDLEAGAKAFREAGQRTGRPVQALRGWEGIDSTITELSFERVVDPERWTAVWQKHAPGVTPPPVDFAKEMVVAIFGGKFRGNTSGISLYGVMENESIDVTTMQIVYDTFAPPELLPPNPHLYLMAVLPLSTKPVTILSRSYGLMHRPQLLYRTMGEIGELRVGR